MLLEMQMQNVSLDVLAEPTSIFSLSTWKRS